MKHIKTYLLYAVFFISMMTNFILAIKVNNHPKGDNTFLAEETEIIQDTLSEWNIFTLALMKVESEYNNNAVSSVGAKGYFQMTPIYVKEVNRVHHTNFTFDQVKDFEKAYEIFDLMQKAHVQFDPGNPAHRMYMTIFDLLPEANVFQINECLMAEGFKPWTQERESTKRLAKKSAAG